MRGVYFVSGLSLSLVLLRVVLADVVGLVLVPLAAFKLVDLVWLSFYVGRSICKKQYAVKQILDNSIIKRRLIPGWKRFQIARSQGFYCDGCWYTLPDTFHIDHFRPLKYQGHDDDFNYHALCPTCHDHKSVVTDRLFNQKLIR
jgi:hypothetical protein